jgi:hypothetical protein
MIYVISFIAAYDVEPTVAAFPTKYIIRKIMISTFFYIIYEDWLKSVDSYFKHEGTLNFVNINKLKVFLVTSLVTSGNITKIEMPCQIPISAVLDKLTLYKNKGEITYELFKRTLFEEPLVGIDVMRIPHTLIDIEAKYRENS